MSLAVWFSLVNACKTKETPIQFEEWVERTARRDFGINDRAGIIEVLANESAHSPKSCSFDPVYRKKAGQSTDGVGESVDGAYEFTYASKLGYTAICVLPGALLIKSFKEQPRPIPTPEDNRKRAEATLKKFRLGKWGK